MSARKPSRPWRLMLITPDDVATTNHRSEPETYRAVTAEQQRIAEGQSDTTRITVHQWDASANRWRLFERITPSRGAGTAR
ncbi:hypothetical protein ABZ419_11320 [Streptomyces cinnamoneus]|uniref:hypothetical protein n=1 Tax=Streptomyces cinnamoneus TaxID=53446 RepID=UPI0033FFEFE0